MTRGSILVATTNRGKLREVQAMLAGLAVTIETLDDFPDMPEPVEDADSFEGNARLKALHYARLAGCWTLADDSGLEVDALHGEPGIHSARFAGPDRDDAANNLKLIADLTGVPHERRAARFRCVVALANSVEVLASASGTVEGLIVDDARGSNGFGYDPHFFIPRWGMTTAEMSPEQKNRISHRSEALRAIRPALEHLVSHTCGENSNDS